jgi:NADH dehydrogenase
VIVVAGGTGRRGSTLVPRLVDAGHEVRVLSRGLSGDIAADVEHVRGDVRSPEDVTRAVAGADVVVSAVQGFAGPGGVTPRSVDREGNLHLIRAAAEAGADVVLVSLTHAAADSPLEIAREKYAAERALRDSGVGWTIVRAAAFAELWIQMLEDTAGRSRRPLVFGRGENPLWWVSVDDVAAELARVAPDGSARDRTIEVIGPDGLTLTELAAKVMRAHGWPGSPRRVPPVALRIASRSIGVVAPKVGRQMSAALAMERLAPEGAAARSFAVGRRSVDELLAARRAA